MPEEIYHLNEHGDLEPMIEERFDLEDKLQELVAEYPKLLSGEQISPDNPRRWILIGREQGIADIVGAGHRWSLDHLLIDQDAIPTLVEAKRSENSEIRRSIVGQMMDYAAHATQTWTGVDIRQAFEERCKAEGKDPSEELTILLQPDDAPDVDKFWEDVETNLRAARLRLLFVADGIPAELARVVEFLNEQMPRTEVLAVEIKQFLGETGRTLVPRVIGRTASAPIRSSGNRPKRTLPELMAAFPDNRVRQAAQRLVDLTEGKGGMATPGSLTFSIRCLSPAWNNPLSLAWINPDPDYSGGHANTNFDFGMDNYELENKPPELVKILKMWTAQFKDDSFAREYSGKSSHVWNISHRDVADNINLIAGRLEKVLQDLLDMPSAVGPAC